MITAILSWGTSVVALLIIIESGAGGIADLFGIGLIDAASFYYSFEVFYLPDM